MAFSLLFYCSLFKLYIITHIIFVNLFNNFHTFIIKFVYYTTTIAQASLFEIPKFTLPKFSLEAIVIIAPVVLAVFMEHIGVDNAAAGRDRHQLNAVFIRAGLPYNSQRSRRQHNISSGGR